MILSHPVNLSLLLPHSLQDRYWMVFFMFITFLFVLYLGYLAIKNAREVPGPLQNVLEVMVIGMYNMGEDLMGREGRKYVPFVFGIGLYVTISNLMGLVPGFLAPTSNINTTIVPALIVFSFYQYLGVRKHGFGYVKHFLGPVPLLAPMMFITEVISHIARPVSLSLRLFGNVMGEDLLILVLFALVPFVVPLPMIFLALFASLLQGYIFMLLTMVYIGGALEEAH